MNLHRCFYCLFLIQFFCCKISTIRNENKSVSEIDALVNLGIQYYGNNPQDALPYLREAGFEYEKIDSFNKAGNMFLNIAGIFEEYSNNQDSAVFYSKRSLENHLKGKDSMQIANLYKYHGYLLGISGKIHEGELLLNKALNYYDRVRFIEGAAVCHFNLARLSFQQKNYSEADSLADIYYYVWRDSDNPARLFLINLLKLKIALATNHSQNIKVLIVKGDSLLMNSNIPTNSINEYNIIKSQIK